MSKETFLKLVDLIRPFAKIRSTRVRKDVISLEKRVAVTLYYLKDQGSMQMTANAFGIARCTVGVVVKEICDILSGELGKELIKFPIDKDDIVKTAEQFQQRFGFPQVIGCVDGTHIPIRQPSENARDYFSYKMCYSLNCQAICDAYGLFTNVEIRWPGSVHDARVFANCEVQKRFSSGKSKLYHKELVPGEETVPQILLGDPAYPLLHYMMKEYDHCKSQEQVVFNQMLRSARNQIECAFGRLKARWRILLRPMDIPIGQVPKIIYACFVLHNFCEKEKEDVDLRVVDQVLQNERGRLKADRYSYSTSTGKKVRDAITSYFKEYL